MDLTICCIKGCNTKSVALGLCNKHWRRNKKYGSPVATQNHTLTKGMTNEERFNFYVVRQKDVGDGKVMWTKTDMPGYQ